MKDGVYMLQQYFTCEGRYSLVYLIHVQLVLNLASDAPINLPYFLWKSLSKMVNSIQKDPKIDLVNYIYHHSLIKLLVS